MAPEEVKEQLQCSTRKRGSFAQRQHVFNTMEKNRDVANGEADCEKDEVKIAWVQLTGELNAMDGGDVRKMEEWRKSWDDGKRRALERLQDFEEALKLDRVPNPLKPNCIRMLKILGKTIPEIPGALTKTKAKKPQKRKLQKSPPPQIQSTSSQCVPYVEQDSYPRPHKTRRTCSTPIDDDSDMEFTQSNTKESTFLSRACNLQQQKSDNDKEVIIVDESSEFENPPSNQNDSDEVERKPPLADVPSFNFDVIRSRLDRMDHKLDTLLSKIEQYYDNWKTENNSRLAALETLTEENKRKVDEIFQRKFIRRWI